MKATVSLETKDVRQIISNYLNIPLENVVPNRYSFSIIGMDASAIAARIYSSSSNNLE